MKSNLTVHCVIKNEERWIWFALKSILDIADKVLVFDTGSSDRTVDIIKTIKSKKIIFEEKDEVDAKGLTQLRREQLKRTKTDWFLILDGDEIWPERTKKELIKKIKSADKFSWGIVVRAWNLVGDVYHYHSESVHYHWPYAPKKFKGWANLRVFRRSVPGIHIKGEYPLEAYCDKDNIPIQNYGEKHLLFLKNRYFHTTYLTRSDTRARDRNVLNRLKKSKMELGLSFPKNFEYPEVFYKKTPNIVPSPWEKRSNFESLISVLQTPFKETRRRVFDLYNPK